MLTRAAKVVVVKLSRLAIRLTCSSYISSKQPRGQFFYYRVYAVKKILKVSFLYKDLERV